MRNLQRYVSIPYLSSIHYYSPNACDARMHNNMGIICGTKEFASMQADFNSNALIGPAYQFQPLWGQFGWFLPQNISRRQRHLTGPLMNREMHSRSSIRDSHVRFLATIDLPGRLVVDLDEKNLSHATRRDCYGIDTSQLGPWAYVNEHYEGGAIYHAVTPR